MANEASAMEPGLNGGGSICVGEEEEEELGSVTQLQHLQEGEHGIQLRTSARVSKKIRLDSQAAAAASSKKVSGGESDEKCVTSQPLSGSGGVEAQRPKGGRRANETSLWSMDDKNAFFESLNEYGKDFEAIHHHIEMKARKRGEQEPKSRDQVRHFYYRTWNKISKHLRFPEGTTKGTQELYGLINYGEMRKKIGYPYTAKNSQKLKELIFLGSTQIRIKGKTWRIKTPICKALRKLNALEDCCEEVKLPPRVRVELRPRDNQAWAHVQSVAHNPRVCAELSLHRRLVSLIAYLQARWRPADVKLRQSLTSPDVVSAAPSSHGINSPGANSSPLYCHSEVVTPVNNTETMAINDSPPEPLTNCSSVPSLAFTDLLKANDNALELCVAPQQGSQMVEASFKMSAIATSAKLSFLAYSDRQGKDYSHILTELQAASKNSRMRAGALKRQRSDSNCERLAAKGPMDADRELLAADQMDAQFADHLALQCDIAAPTAGQHFSDSFFHHQPLPDETVCMGGGGDVSSPVKDEIEQDTEPVSESAAETRERLANVMERTRSGWTTHNADAMRIGELYVMFGSDSRLVLEYWWRKNGETEMEQKPAVDTASTPPLPSPSPVAVALQKLVSLAKLSYRKTRVTCPCGHVCQPPDAVATASGAPPARGVARVRAPAKLTADSTAGTQPPTTGNAAQQPNSAASACTGASVGLAMDGVFRRPLLAPLRPKADTVDQFKFKAQLDKFRLLRFCNRRGRNSRSKNVVVPRMLPLLPKVPADKQLMLKVVRPIDSGMARARAGASGGGDVSAPLPTFTPILPKDDLPPVSTSHLISFTPTVATYSIPLPTNDLLVPINVPQLPNSTDLLTKDDDLNKDADILDLPKTDTVEDEPPPSPMRLLKEEMLINTDDYSLSSLLGHLESPEKSCSAVFDEDHQHGADVSCDDSRLPDVDAQLHSLMCEDSVDYMGKFADLAAKLTSDSLTPDNE